MLTTFCVFDLIAAAELKERRLNEEKQKALRKIALIESIKTDMTKVLAENSQKQNKLLTESSQRQNNYLGGTKSAMQMMEDSMSQITKVYECYNNGLSRWNEMMLNDIRSAGSSTSTNKPDV